MASKNPIKGYIACPTQGCGEVCTIHAVGEHKILEGGDPPKNKRRLGQLYTICPRCKTNQSAGKPFQDWLKNHMVSSPEKVATGRISSSGDKSNQTPPSKTNETKSDKACCVIEPSENVTTKTTNIRLGWSLLALIGTCCLLWIALSTRKKSGINHEH
ncbi:hypothetical protein LRP52_44985 [Photobacterium sp. ZSDE20]|nr:hypothetical protein [Photobacterium sp. ZSDE20]